MAKHTPNLTEIGHRNSKYQTLIKEPKMKKILRRRRRSQTQARKPTISFPKSLSLARKTHKRATQRETRKTMNYYVTGLPSWMTSSRKMVDELKTVGLMS